MRYLFHCAALAALAVSGDALAVGAIARVAIIDRETGVTLTPHYYRGEYWVAGSPGARYSIEIRNCIGGRLLAVTSVDGVNVLSGATAGWDQTGYVFDPGERYEIAGWRKSDAEVAAFTFTESPNSYAERTGRPANVGVIGVALFRERVPQPVYTPPVYRPRVQEPAPDDPIASPLAKGSSAAGATVDEARSSSAAPSTSNTPSTPSRAMPSPSVASAEQPTAKLGTGHGAREYSYVSHTEFARTQTEPNEVIRIHYDSLANLIAMGIVRGPRPAAAVANPFPASPEQHYVADPPG